MRLRSPRYANTAMPTLPRALHLNRPGWAWLLWLALLALPLAQAATHWHGLSHASAAAAGADTTDKQAAHLAHCDLCLGAAALGTGATAGQPSLVMRPAVRHQSPPLGRTGLWVAPAPRAYRSRAPPHASH